MVLPGVEVARRIRRGKEDPAEARLARLGGVKEYLFLGACDGSGCGRDRQRPLKEDLPLPLPEEQAEGEVYQTEATSEDSDQPPYKPLSGYEGKLLGHWIIAGTGA